MLTEDTIKQRNEAMLEVDNFDADFPDGRKYYTDKEKERLDEFIKLIKEGVLKMMSKDKIVKLANKLKEFERFSADMDKKLKRINVEKYKKVVVRRKKR